MSAITDYKFYMTQKDKKKLVDYLAIIEFEYFKVAGEDNATAWYLDGIRTHIKSVLNNVEILKGK